MRYHDVLSRVAWLCMRPAFHITFSRLPFHSFHSISDKASMKGDNNIIRLLNAQLTNELSAINQYFLHARMYQHWGFEKIGKKEYEESIGEMKHADKLINRILMLEGLPNLQALHKLMLGESTPEMLQYDLKLEQMTQKTVGGGGAAGGAAGGGGARGGGRGGRGGTGE